MNTVIGCECVHNDIAMPSRLDEECRNVEVHKRWLLYSQNICQEFKTKTVTRAAFARC